MKSHPANGLGIGRSLLLCTWLVCASVLALAGEVRAEPTNDPSSESDKPAALQDLMRRERRSGPVYVAIPVAYRYGLGQQTYCSPSIRATNSSNQLIEELIVGIDYTTAAGKPAGGTISRYADIKVRHQATHYFYQLAVSDCAGLEGHVSVVRCVYSTGEDCSAAVQPIDFGTIRLRLKPR